MCVRVCVFFSSWSAKLNIFDMYYNHKVYPNVLNKLLCQTKINLNEKLVKLLYKLTSQRTIDLRHNNILIHQKLLGQHEQLFIGRVDE